MCLFARIYVLIICLIPTYLFPYLLTYFSGIPFLFCIWIIALLG